MAGRPKGDRERKAQRGPKALELRIAGASFRQIAQQLGINEATAYRDVQGALATLDAAKTQQAERLRELELERCDRMTLALGRKVAAGEERAILALVRVMEQRCKLLGLYEPERHEHGGGLIVRWLRDDEPVT